MPSNGVTGDGQARSGETKRDAFKRLAVRRTNAVLDKLRILSNCANPYAYEWDDDDIRQIFGSIDQEVKLARARFQQVQRSRREFKLQ